MFEEEIVDVLDLIIESIVLVQNDLQRSVTLTAFPL